VPALAFTRESAVFRVRAAASRLFAHSSACSRVGYTTALESFVQWRSKAPHHAAAPRKVPSIRLRKVPRVDPPRGCAAQLDASQHRTVAPDSRRQSRTAAPTA